jgi:hypothetical protein
MNIGFILPEIEMPPCLIRRIMYRQAFRATCRTDEFPTPLEVRLYMQLPLCAIKHNFVFIAIVKIRHYLQLLRVHHRIKNTLEFRLHGVVAFLDKPQGYGSLFLKGGTVTPVNYGR